MGDVNQHSLAGVNVTTSQARAAAVHIADQVGAEHPGPLDGPKPELAGKQLAADPAVADELRDLLAALGIRPDQIRRNDHA